MKTNLFKRRIGAALAAIAAVLARILCAFDLRDAFVFGGLGLAGYGIALVHRPAAFVVVGVALFWLGTRKGSE